MGKWTEQANVVKSETQGALQLVYDTLNKGQKQKLVNDEKIKALFDRYGVVYSE